MSRSKFLSLTVFMVPIIGFFVPLVTAAAPSTSTNYRLDPDAFNTAGGLGSSTNYKLLNSVGEPLIGSGSGGSYKLSSGFVSQLDQSIQLSVNPSGLFLYYPLGKVNALLTPADWALYISRTSSALRARL